MVVAWPKLVNCNVKQDCMSELTNAIPPKPALLAISLQQCFV